MGCFWQQPIQKGFAAGDVTIKKKSGSQTAALQKSHYFLKIIVTESYRFVKDFSRVDQFPIIG